MHVDVFAEQLAQRLDQPRMAGEQAKRLVEGVGGEGGARRAGLLAPHFLAIELENRLGFVAQLRDFLLGKTVRKEQVALLVETLGVERLISCMAFPDDTMAMNAPRAGAWLGPI